MKDKKISEERKRRRKNCISRFVSLYIASTRKENKGVSLSSLPIYRHLLYRAKQKEDKQISVSPEREEDLDLIKPFFSLYVVVFFFLFSFLVLLTLSSSLVTTQRRRCLSSKSPSSSSSLLPTFSLSSVFVVLSQGEKENG